MASTSVEIRRGGTAKAQGIDSDILLASTITSATLAAELAKYPSVAPGTFAYNLQYLFDPTHTDALVAALDPDGKWYDGTMTEVT